MHGLEGNKVFAAILFGIFAALGVAFVPRILTEFTDPKSHVRQWLAHPGEEHHDKPACDPETGRHAIIPGMCLTPERPKPQMPTVPFLIELANADPNLGAAITGANCSGCHNFEKDNNTAKTGPNLWDVVDAQYGSNALYSNYSGALAGDGRVWDYEGLNAFLLGPGSWVPGTKMSYAGQADQTKRALHVAYLRTLSDDPLPLPSQEELDALQAEYDAAVAQYEIDLAAWEAGE